MALIKVYPRILDVLDLTMFVSQRLFNAVCLFLKEKLHTKHAVFPHEKKIKSVIMS